MCEKLYFLILTFFILHKTERETSVTLFKVQILYLTVRNSVIYFCFGVVWYPSLCISQTVSWTVKSMMIIFVENLKNFKIGPHNFSPKVNWKGDNRKNKNEKNNWQLYFCLEVTWYSSLCNFWRVSWTVKSIRTIIVENLRSFKVDPNKFSRRVNWKGDNHENKNKKKKLPNLLLSSTNDIQVCVSFKRLLGRWKVWGP